MSKISEKLTAMKDDEFSEDDFCDDPYDFNLQTVGGKGSNTRTNHKKVGKSNGPYSQKHVRLTEMRRK
jgi:hypothetical protein